MSTAKPAHDYNPAEIGEFFKAGDGREVMVTHSRKGVPKTVTFKLRSAI